MAQRQQNVGIQAPGFQGLNTEDSPLVQDPGFCSVADNCVIDSEGRIGAREAFASLTTTDNVPYNSYGGLTASTKTIYQIGGGFVNSTNYVRLGILGQEFVDGSGVVSLEDFHIVRFYSDGRMEQIDFASGLGWSTPANLREAQIVHFNDKVYIYSRGNWVWEYDGTTFAPMFNGTANVDYFPPQDTTGTLASDMDGDVVLSAYGRTWVTGVDGDYNTIWFSDLLNPKRWYDGRTPGSPGYDPLNTGGFINVAEFWPSGGDRIVGLAAHNNFLIAFGRQNILLYANAIGDPAAADGIFLQDSVLNIGLVARDGVINIGADVLFLDDTGVRSLGRTIQEKSVPIGDLTRNVRKDISFSIAAEAIPSQNISMFYMPDKNVAVALFSDSAQAYAIDLRAPSSTGGSKITRWTGCHFQRGWYVEFDEGNGAESFTILAAKHTNFKDVGAQQYGGYIQHNSLDYTMDYVSNIFTFGDSTVQKFVKKVDFFLNSQFLSSDAVVRWGFDGLLEYSATKNIIAQLPALFGEAYYNQSDLYGPGQSQLRRYRTNMKGSGSTVTVGLSCAINGNFISIQEINIQTLIGRIY